MPKRKQPEAVTLDAWLPTGEPLEMSAYDHEAFYFDGTPTKGEAFFEDTGLRCVCGREVVAVLDDDETRTGWAHVGVGDAFDRTGMLRTVA